MQMLNNKLQAQLCAYSQQCMPNMQFCPCMQASCCQPTSTASTHTSVRRHLCQLVRYQINAGCKLYFHTYLQDLSHKAPLCCTCRAPEPAHPPSPATDIPDVENRCVCYTLRTGCACYTELQGVAFIKTDRCILSIVGCRHPGLFTDPPVAHTEQPDQNMSPVRQG